MTMNLKQDSREIDGLTFKTQQFAAMRAFTLLGRLVKTVGPALGALMKLDPKLALETAGLELADAFASLDPDQAARLIPEIFASTDVEVDGKHIPLTSEGNINLVFSGRLRTLFSALGFVLQVNYRDFIGGGLNAPSLNSLSVS